MDARVYVYSGMWVADCPRECGNTERMTDTAYGVLVVRKAKFVCSYCKYQTDQVEWPAEIEAIDRILQLRPIPHTRNWYPKNHKGAIKFRIPHGQTLEELIQENADHGIGE